jgi:adenylate cyclase
MDGLTPDDVAARVGVDPRDVDDLVRLGILKPTREDGSFTQGTVQTTRVIRDLEASGISRASLAQIVRDGSIDFGMFEIGAYDRFASATDQSFREAAERWGVPLPVVLLIREAIGFAVADPDERMREDELDILPLLQVALVGGMPTATRRTHPSRLLRGPSPDGRDRERGLGEPRDRAGARGRAAAAAGLEMGARWGELAMPTLDRAILAIHRGQQGHVWMSAIVGWVEQALEQAGLAEPVTHPPAMCFVDLSGFTNLTEEQGDQAAAATALTFSSLVQRTAHERRGRVVKCLGDGVMLHFGEPADAIVGALEMTERVPAAGLPQAQVGVDAGPVIVQDGDCFGSTVNAAARIAAYARSGEVLASERAMSAANGLPKWFLATDIGAADLKGMSKPVALRKVAARCTCPRRCWPSLSS